MLQNLFRRNRHEIEIDETLELSIQTLIGRMDTMLEREALKKMRFATLENTPSYLR
jgi:hypothetical protein